MATQDSESVFFDIHCHAMNLSHPGLVAFIRRFIHTLTHVHKPRGNWFGQLIKMIKVIGRIVHVLVVLFIYLVRRYLKMEIHHGGKKTGLLGSIWEWMIDRNFVKRTANLLCIMEQDMGVYFKLMEKDAAEIVCNNGINSKSHFNDMQFSKVVITPLIMDFGHRDKHWFVKTHYDISQKPIEEQIIDVLNGIKAYRRNPGNTLEIYPFLGINTLHYESKDLNLMLNASFGKYIGLHSGQRLSKLRENNGKFSGDIKDIGDFQFAGIKVYPPLGFDPWPPPGEERNKVMDLYKFCSENRVPITSHCSSGGFSVLNKNTAKNYTSPQKWADVLEEYPMLTLDIAHFGGGIVEKNLLWMNKITHLVRKYENVYTDFSCQCFDNDDYGELYNYIKMHNGAPNPREEPHKLEDKILFGSDFMINLFWIDSYKGYLKEFAQTDNLQNYRKKFCSTNPHNFLFG